MYFGASWEPCVPLATPMVYLLLMTTIGTSSVYADHGRPTPVVTSHGHTTAPA